MKTINSLINEMTAIIESATYSCSICGRKVYPIIKTIKPAEDSEKVLLELVTDSFELRGGKGNNIAQKNVCAVCHEGLGGGLIDNLYYKEMLEKGADGVDFVALNEGFFKKDPLQYQVFQSATLDQVKESKCFPKSPRVYWEFINGRKEYLP